MPKWQKPIRGTMLNRAHPRARGLVCSLLMNGRGVASVTDEAGNGLAGLILGNSSWVGTRYGFGINFPGASGDRLSVTDNPLLDITGAISIEILLATSDGNAGVVGRDDYDGSLTYYFVSTNSKVYSIGLLSNVIYWQIGSGSGASACSGSATALLDGNWHHLIATWDGTTGTNGMKLYLDGRTWIQATSAISSIKAGSKDLDIGGGGSNWPMAGQMALVNLYSRYIDPAEAAQCAANPFAAFQHHDLAWLYAAPAGGAGGYYYRYQTRLWGEA